MISMEFTQEELNALRWATRHAYKHDDVIPDDEWESFTEAADKIDGAK